MRRLVLPNPTDKNTQQICLCRRLTRRNDLIETCQVERVLLFVGFGEFAESDVDYAQVTNGTGSTAEPVRPSWSHSVPPEHRVAHGRNVWIEND